MGVLRYPSLPERAPLPGVARVPGAGILARWRESCLAGPEREIAVGLAALAAPEAAGYLHLRLAVARMGTPISSGCAHRLRSLPATAGDPVPATAVRRI